jgi:hypothetical protein
MLRRVWKALHRKTHVLASAEAACSARPARARQTAIRARGARSPGAAALAFLVAAAALIDAGPAMAGLITDPELDAAMSCGAAKKPIAPCDVAACFSRYLANTPPADVAPEARTMLSNAASACRPGTQQQDTKSDEERMLAQARQCMVTAEPCVVKTCFADYLKKYGATGGLRSIAQNDISRADHACVPKPQIASIADGTYNARAKEGCGVSPQFGIRIAIKDGAISWEHDFRGISYKWSGVIDPTGEIRASVGNSKELVANGDAAREIQMHYPQCGATAISLIILSRMN